MKFFYGYDDSFDDITDQVYEKCIMGDVIVIPFSDVDRSNIFNDPAFGFTKIIKMIDTCRNVYELKENIFYVLDMNTGEQLVTMENREKLWNRYLKNIPKEQSQYKLEVLHQTLNIQFGSIKDEYPEQLMTMKYLDEDSVVLEIGGNIGRNSCVISSLLNDDKNLVVLESHPDIVKQLESNRDINKFKFHIENSALSMVPLIQKDWNTKVSSTVPVGWIKINTITFEELEEKYGLKFNTFVLDCEGAFFKILVDSPECLTNVHTVIIENDFTDINQKKYIDSVLNNYGLHSVYKEAGGWGPCYDKFYEVFKK